jgi:predicted transcriptional regulator
MSEGKETRVGATVRLDTNLNDRLRQVAEEEDRPISRIVRQALREYLDRKTGR